MLEKKFSKRVSLLLYFCVLINNLKIKVDLGLMQDWANFSNKDYLYVAIGKYDISLKVSADLFDSELYNLICGWRSRLETVKCF